MAPRPLVWPLVVDGEVYVRAANDQQSGWYVEEEDRGMGEAENRQTVERVFQALTEGQVELFHAQFHEDSVIEFPQSGERIAGGESRRAVYRAFPGRPSVRRIVTGGDLAVVEAAVDYGDGVGWRAVFIYELRDGKIARATAYWAQPFEAAASRADWVQPIDG